MKQHRIVISVPAAILGLLLAGCGGGDGGGEGEAASGQDRTEEYCQALEEAKADIDALEQGDVEGFEQSFETISELADKAPEEVAAEWQTLDTALAGLEDSLAEAGLELADLEQLTAGQVPEGVDTAQLEKLAADMRDFGSTEVQEASDKISAHARTECGIDLDGQGTGGGDTGTGQPSETPSE